MFIGSILAAALSLTLLSNNGTSYPIAEPDMSVEIEQRAQQIDHDAVQHQLADKYKNYTPPDLPALLPAKKSRSYYVDMTYTLDRDIPTVDGNGKVTGVLYPQGYRYNPLEYMLADPPPLVIFNGDSKAERAFVAKRFKDNTSVMLILTAGKWQQIAEEMKRPVYFLKSSMAKKLNLAETVSVVYKEGKRMRVDVYAVNERTLTK